MEMDKKTDIFTDFVITPYYRYYQVVEGDSEYLPRKNYSSYHLFCLKKNISPYIYSLNKDYSVNLVLRKDGDREYITVEILNGSENVSLSEKLKEFIQKAIDKSIERYPKCFIYDFNLIKGRRKNWSIEVFKFDENKYEMIRGKLYCLNLYLHINHSDVWDRKFSKIENFLNDSYQKGVIYLSDSFLEENRDFLYRWSLSSLSNDLYCPEWETNIVKDKAMFLRDRKKGIKKFVYFSYEDGNRYKSVDIEKYSDLLLLR